jgi:hypothetical protein
LRERSIHDDASRKVLASGKLDNATEDNSLKVMTWTQWGYFFNCFYGSNLRIAETPNDAFIRKMHPEVWLGFCFQDVWLVNFMKIVEEKKLRVRKLFWEMVITTNFQVGPI